MADLDLATRLEMLRDPKATYSTKDLGRALSRAAQNVDDICKKLPQQTDDHSLTYEARFVQLTIAIFSHMVTEGLPAKALGRRAQPHTVEEMFWRQYDHLHELLDEAIEGEVENRAVQVAENLIADARREFEREQKLLDDQYQSLQEAHQSLQARYEAALLEIETLEQYKTELDTLTRPSLEEVVMPKKPAQKHERIRISQAAKMLGITSKEFIATLHAIEHTQYTHHANTLEDPEIIDHVAEVLDLNVRAAA
jgi:hypothetical protein